MNITISSPQALAPLARIADLTRAFYSSEDSSTQSMALRDSVRAFMLDHLSPFRNYLEKGIIWRKELKSEGHRLSRAIASVRKNPKSIERAYEYLSIINQMTYQFAFKFEPSFVIADRKSTRLNSSHT